MYYDVESEIDSLESVLNSLEAARIDVQDTPYHSHLAQSWELDIEDIKARLDELYAMQDDQWKKEMQQQNFDYERSIWP